ncbi:hypothetical protein EHW99_0951 [Erwinia amylovora]|uniref:Uncharacterized protein n=2 Tax=Erwinia amylovora TaxID=552 RepID=A0A831A091_ERWAM|nr:hypothetical protein EaACW_2668 [Erwinia amylovora ACW56400]QJQ53658.1 hypothetical protein EHX00_0951 [Erwinia amylovora]CBA22136.1 hypothetical protein predicted by Glimmer/Critica [Erwinia amylovora CFBP1430]CCO79512.1 hypothetical protein BN432_2733 [Erwinia amylovora Ea356]CCO83314.1 hypothetical protein BN433_2755 [Erwinia amylovora Ea266]CCO87077.1 hypothetical protein BN434_2707 [Erwinia amylovora CFBP 2585]CCO94654.1 hypothetical protein BN437_2744 [Erwinia amylovora NBRC 12687 = 
MQDLNAVQTSKTALLFRTDWGIGLIGKKFNRW